MPPIPFATGTDISRSLPLNRTQLVNGFIEMQPPSSKSQVPIFGAPGLSNFSLPGAGPIRGMWVAQDLIFCVSGAKLFSIDALGFAEELGDGIGGYGPVSMSDNGIQLCLTSAVAGGFIYTFPVGNVGGSFQEIIDDAFYPANTVTFLDGYFIFDRAGTNEFFLSELYDGLSYNGLDFASAEAAPGKVVATIQNLQVQFVFATKHIELWYDAGTADFPLARYPGGVINKGLVSPSALVLEDDCLWFLCTDKMFYKLQGNTPQRVSNHSIEHIISQDPDLTQALCFSYTLEGHKLVHLVLPASKRTLVYDLSTQRWHERESWNSRNKSLGRWRGNCAVAYNGNNYIGDAFDNHVGLLNWDVSTEYGNVIRLLAYSPSLQEDRQRLFISRFELDVESGVGTTDGVGSDPEIRLEVSRDGGRTFGVLQPHRSIGRRGAYLTRQRWLRMGNARQWVFRISITDPVKRNIISAHADIEVGV